MKKLLIEIRDTLWTFVFVPLFMWWVIYTSIWPHG